VADAVSVVEVVKGDGAEASVFWTERLLPAVKPPVALMSLSLTA
jgi:hypothetical protein